MAGFNPQGNVSGALQGGSFGGGLSLQGSAPQLQAAPNSGLQVQPAANTPNLNQTPNAGTLSLAGQPSPPNAGGTQVNTGPTAAEQAAAVQAQNVAQNNAYYDSQIGQTNNQIGNLDNQANIGRQNINEGYNNQFNQLQSGKALETRNFDQNKATMLQNYTLGRDQVGYQTGQQANGLERLLGSHGYSGSANQAVGYLAGQQGAQQDAGLDRSFGRESQAAAQNFGDYTDRFNTSVSGLGSQRDNNLNRLQASNDSTRAGLLSTLANLGQQRGANNGQSYSDTLAAAKPYTDQVNSLSDQITNLGHEFQNPAYNVQQAAYKAPTAESYVPGQRANAQVGLSGAQQNISPFLTLLQGDQQKKQGVI